MLVLGVQIKAGVLLTETSLQPIMLFKISRMDSLTV